MGMHRKQAENLKRLGISHRAAANDLHVPRSSFSRYLLAGTLPTSLKARDLPARLELYIKKRSGQVNGRGVYRAAPMRGKFSQLGLSLEQIAEAIGVDRMVLKRGIYAGCWVDEKTKTSIENWIDRRIDLGEGKMINPVSLTQESLDFFHLKFDPWGEITNPGDILVTKEVSHALKLCKGCIERGEMLAITGPVGCGKTILLRKVDEWAATRSDIMFVKPAVLEKQYLRGSHVVSAILEDLGMAPGSHSSLEHLARFLRRALEQAHIDGRIVVLVLDEGHLIPLETLLFLKRIYEVEKNGEKLLRILLVGQPSLARQLKTNFQLSELGQRIRLYELGGLNGAAASYLRHRLDRAGANGREIFDGGAVKTIVKKCSTPLEVNACAGLAMVAAYSVGEKIVSKEAVEMVQGGYRG